jgi:phosphomannomutase
MTVSPDAFKAYDIRGLYPQELDAEGARRIGAALAAQLGARRLAVGHDPRLSSPELAAAFAVGAEAAGAQVTGFGMIPTEMLYFGVADRGFDGGAAVTASHNPPQYNGMKLVGEGALPLSGDAGIPELKRRVLDMERAPAAGEPHLTLDDLYPDYVEHLLAQVDAGSLRPYRVVMDAANGAAGRLAPLLFDRTPIARVELYFEVDGRFPNHEPNPLLEQNSRELRERVVAEKGDLGIAWDGDADRCFFIDEAGAFVPGDFVTALLAEALLARHPGAKILYDLRASRAVPDTIRAAGGEPLVNRVGHAFFKQRMRRESVLFGGEVSGHYYFQANHNADSGFIPALLILELLSRKQATMAELLAPLRSTYFISGEINSRVDDVPAALARIEERFADGAVSHLDGVSVDYPDWQFNVRPSNTEPLLRLNLGATSAAQMEEKRDLVLSIILQDGAS